MCGSRPEPEAVTASAGMSAGVDAVEVGDRSLAVLDRGDEIAVLRAVVRAARRAAVVAVAGGRGARTGSTAGSGLPAASVNDCPIRAEPTAVPSLGHQRPVRLPGQDELADPGDEQRVAETEHDGEDEHGAEGDVRLRRVVRVVDMAGSPSVGSEARDEADDEVDEPDADERGDDAAEAVDEQVAAQDRDALAGRYFDAAQGERDQQRR